MNIDKMLEKGVEAISGEKADKAAYWVFYFIAAVLVTEMAIKLWNFIF